MRPFSSARTGHNRPYSVDTCTHAVASLREPTDGRPYSSLCDCPCRLSGVHAPSHVHDRRGRCWRVIHDHDHDHHRRRPWHGGFNDCQTDSTLLSEFHAKTVLMARVIGEPRVPKRCRYSCSESVPPAQEGSRAEACFREGALLASSKITIHRIIIHTTATLTVPSNHDEILHSSSHA